jgi:hypothetical protein
MIRALPFYVVYRILLGLSAEYTLRNAYLREVNAQLVQHRGEQIGRVGDPDLPSGGFDVSFLLKPDILDKHLKHFYEIKPNNLIGVLRGQAQLAAYTAAIALRWPGEIYLPGPWAPRDVLYFLEVPSFIEGAPIELPAFILAYQHEPGLIVYDELTLSAQAFALGIATTYAIDGIAMLGTRLGLSGQQLLEWLRPLLGPGAAPSLPVANLVAADSRIFVIRIGQISL